MYDAFSAFSSLKEMTSCSSVRWSDGAARPAPHGVSPCAGLQVRGRGVPAGSSGRKPGLLGLPPETAASGTEERRWQWIQTRPCVGVRGLIVISDASPHRPPVRVPAAGRRGRLGRRASVAIGRRAASVQGMVVSPAAWPPRAARGDLCHGWPRLAVSDHRKRPRAPRASPRDMRRARSPAKTRHV